MALQAPTTVVPIPAHERLIGQVNGTYALTLAVLSLFFIPAGPIAAYLSHRAFKRDPSDPAAKIGFVVGIVASVELLIAVLIAVFYFWVVVAVVIVGK